MSNKLEDIELRSEQVQDILTYIPHWMIRYGSVLFLVLIMTILVLSWFIKYPDILEAEAILTTETPPQKEYAQVSGKIEAILIKDNTVVTQNTPLAILENTANYNDVFKLKTVIDTIKVNNTTFHFPIEELPVLFLGDIDTDFALFENHYIQYTLNSKLQPFSNDLLANKISLSELHRRLESSKNQLTLNKAELSLKETDFKRTKILFKNGTIARLEYEQKEIKLKQAQRDLINFESSISQIREAISNAKKTSKGTKINRTKEEMMLLKNVIQSFKQLKKSIQDWEYRYTLTSNIEGSVTFSNYWKTNETVTQGDLMFTITPSQSSAYISKLKIRPNNSGKLKKGQIVNITLDNYPNTEFGTIQGTIETLSLIQDKNGFYTITAKHPSTLKTSYNKNIIFKQEMTGSAKIITEDLRLIERFFYKLKDVFKR